MEKSWYITRKWIKRRGIERLPTPDSHVDGEKGTKTIVYNTKRGPKEGDGKRKTRKELKVEEIQQ